MSHRTPILIFLTALGCNEPNGSGVVDLVGQDIAYAAFSAGSHACQNRVTTVGPCTYSSEESSCSANAEPREAGVVTLSDGDWSIQMGPDQTATYTWFANQPWTPGEQISVAASGDQVPAFHGTVTIPVAPRINGFPADGVAIDRSTDLPLSWESQPGSMIHISITQTDRQVPWMSCDFPAEAGAGTIPAAALKSLAAGNADLTASVIEAAELNLPGWNVVLEATANLAVGSSGVAVTGSQSVSLQ